MADVEQLDFDERLPAISINPDMATRDDVFKMAGLLMAQNAAVEALRQIVWKVDQTTGYESIRVDTVMHAAREAMARLEDHKPNQLYASAPDLLAALEELKAECVDVIDPNTKAMRKARTAIAKAKPDEVSKAIADAGL